VNRQFAIDYAKIRAADGHGELIARNFGRLPYLPRGERHAGIWSIRRRSFETLVRRVLPSIGARLRILDLGAGIGWLSARLAELEHEPCAIDICIEGIDGLAARPDNATWPRVCAEFDHLPIAPASVDVALFNGSFHYSTDYGRTLKEAARVIKPDGGVVIMDTPLYHSAASGEAMAAELRSGLRARCGIEPMPCRQFLTWGELEALGAMVGLSWQVYRPRYGIKAPLRSWAAKPRGQREPAGFAVLVARRRSP
jgi:SAM-dependent methyltransferase